MANTERNNTVISVKNVATRFTDKQVHEDVSFDVRRGSITGLIGGSGSGKSVLLREILGLHRPTSGNVRILGMPIWEMAEEDLSRLRNRLGVLFQDGALFSALTVRENVEVPMRESLQLSNSLIEIIANLRLRLSGLSQDVGRKMPSQLSGGMVKRAAIARALALEPEILFLDEPTSGLDPINARSIDRLIKTLSLNLGLTVLLITHDVLTLKAITDELVVLYQGKVLAQGSYIEVSKLEHPWIKAYFSRQNGC